MNVLLWILQSGLALLLLSGGGYKVASRHALANDVGALPSSAWAALGVLEVVAGLLLVVPAATNWLPGLTPLAAIVVAVESVFLSAVYARKSTALSASNPLVWSATMALVAALVAYGRTVLVPFA